MYRLIGNYLPGQDYRQVKWSDRLLSTLRITSDTAPLFLRCSLWRFIEYGGTLKYRNTFKLEKIYYKL